MRGNFSAIILPTASAYVYIDLAASAKEKLTQAQDWDAWPTTFFVGRDGLVKLVHAGFSSPGSGELYRRDKAEFVATVERLLAENQSARK